MSTTIGPFYPTSVTETTGGGGTSWTNVDLSHVGSDDGTTADYDTSVGGGISQILILTFGTATGLGVPSGATIVGIEIDAKLSADNASGTKNVEDSAMLLYLGGSQAGDKARSASFRWPTTAAYAVFGGPSDLWGNPWINLSDTIGFGIEGLGSGTTFGHVDTARLYITYTTGGTPSVPAPLFAAASLGVGPAPAGGLVRRVRTNAIEGTRFVYNRQRRLFVPRPRRIIVA